MSLHVFFLCQPSFLTITVLVTEDFPSSTPSLRVDSQGGKGGEGLGVGPV